MRRNRSENIQHWIDSHNPSLVYPSPSAHCIYTLRCKVLQKERLTLLTVTYHIVFYIESSVSLVIYGAFT